MKIIFICGSLEPGKDGVGDYSRRFCAHLKKQNIAVGIMAYNDKFIDTTLEEEQFSDNETITCYRLPKTLNSKTRCVLAKQWVNTQNPDWLSLQFVPYAFNKKGLPFGLAKQLQNIGKGRKWHIMFHELWLGLRNTDSVKFKIIGFIQKQIIKSFKIYLNIQESSTHTKLYLRELQNLNFKTNYLPVFSNIDFCENSKETEFYFDENSINIVHFGAIHPNVPIKSLANNISLLKSGSINKEIVFNFIGRSNNELKIWKNILKENNIKYKIFGELSPKEISQILQISDFGLTTNPIFVIEKSGTVAAMREHNLPILVISENTKPNNEIEIKLGEQFFIYRNDNFLDFINTKSKKSNFNVKGVQEIVNDFIVNLSN